MEKEISSLDKRILLAACIFTAVYLGLVAWAAMRFGISVPGCVNDVKPFTAGDFIKHSENRYEVHVLSKMWSFEPNVIRVPAGSVVDFYVTSKDVTHGFYVEGTNANLMILPNVVSYAQVRFDKTGTRRILCHEFCGTGHQQMNALLEVIPAGQEGSAEGLPAALTATAGGSKHPGYAVLEDYACFSCHTIDGTTKIGPSFKGLWGRTEQFSDGSSKVADASYIKESIHDPQKKIVKGFPKTMPKYPVTDDEIAQIIEYIKTLK